MSPLAAHASSPSSPPRSASLLGKRRPPLSSDGTLAVRSRLPALTPLYHVLPRAEALLPSAVEDTATPLTSSATITLSGPTSFSLTAPSAGVGERVLEYQLLRPVLVELRASRATTEEEDRFHGCDGWMASDDENSVTLLLPASDDHSCSLLRLVDDDKQAGLTQASLPDLLLRMQIRSSGARGRPP